MPQKSSPEEKGGSGDANIKPRVTMGIVWVTNNRSPWSGGSGGSGSGEARGPSEVTWVNTCAPLGGGALPLFSLCHIAGEPAWLWLPSSQVTGTEWRQAYLSISPHPSLSLSLSLSLSHTHTHAHTHTHTHRKSGSLSSSLGPSNWLSGPCKCKLSRIISFTQSQLIREFIYIWEVISQQHID